MTAIEASSPPPPQEEPAPEEDPDVRDWVNVIALTEALDERDAEHEGDMP